MAYSFTNEYLFYETLGVSYFNTPKIAFCYFKEYIYIYIFRRKGRFILSQNGIHKVFILFIHLGAFPLVNKGGKERLFSIFWIGFRLNYKPSNVRDGIV